MEENTFWTEVLKKPKFIVAPMVDASELAWRLFSRHHGAQLCYTPMYHSAVFIKDTRYRTDALATTPEDRPLIVQFCGNDPDVLCEAALLAEPYCDAIDINLGCPQSIAKRGRYGAFLQDDWELLTQIVKALKSCLRVPVTCKIRIYEDIQKTVDYAKMLETAGCQMLTVHGRTKEQKGPLTGIASWRHIAAVKQNLKIPVLANGNIQCVQDVENCILETGCDGVMSAEGNLYNPAIFEATYPPCWKMTLEYLEYAEKYPCPLSYIRGHVFKMLHHILSVPENKDIRAQIADRSSIEGFREAAIEIRNRYEKIHDGVQIQSIISDSYDLTLPPWLCKSYIRPTPEEHLKRQKILNEMPEGTPAKVLKQEGKELCDRKMSKKKYKKLLRFPDKVFAERKPVVLCSEEDCRNPMGIKCEYKLCKTCCRTKCYDNELDCLGHGILIKTRREKARSCSGTVQQKQNLSENRIYNGRNTANSNTPVLGPA